MSTEDPMPPGTAFPKEHEVVNDTVPNSRKSDGIPPSASHILRESGLATLVCLLLAASGYAPLAFAVGILAFGLLTVWINAAFVRSKRMPGKTPGWLGGLEKLRQYVANEGDESSGRNNSGGMASSIASRS